MSHILDNASKIMEAAGSSLENVCRRQAFHTDFKHFAESIAEREQHFPDVKPASTTIEIDELAARLGSTISARSDRLRHGAHFGGT
ncbi:MAG TPA: RidA family protein [Candidatus Handelsmanbacteria bacterium]|nr:RidA family protein [Candidatus Handelsmanbacteria bacterium]